jgi:hypothetical protein
LLKKSSTLSATFIFVKHAISYSVCILEAGKTESALLKKITSLAAALGVDHFQKMHASAE